MNKWLTAWVKSKYKEVYRDLCTCFIKRGMSLAEDKGYEALITSDTCMYISSFERMRKMVIDRTTIVTFIDTRGTNAHPDVFDANAGWVLWNHHGENVLGAYFKLNHPIAEKGERLLEALADPDCGWFYRADADEYGAIPGSPIAYWASRSALSSFGIGNSFGSLAFPSAGITTGDNATFIHFWWEQDISCISFSTKSFDGRSNSFKWFPCNKGGEFRKWYGNREYVMAFDDCSISTMRSLPGYRPVNLDKQFKPSISWSDITSGLNSFRANGSCALYDHVSISAFPSDSDFDFLLAFANSSVAAAFLSFLAPTLHCNAGDIAKLPVLEKKHFCGEQSVKECLNAAKLEWDSFEVSWDYKRHPLV